MSGFISGQVKEELRDMIATLLSSRVGEVFIPTKNGKEGHKPGTNTGKSREHEQPCIWRDKRTAVFWRAQRSLQSGDDTRVVRTTFSCHTKGTHGLSYKR